MKKASTNAPIARSLTLAPRLVVECVVFSVHEGKLAVLLSKRNAEPFEGLWSLPSGPLAYNEPLERAAARILDMETGLTSARFEQFGTVGTPGRDPRGHTVSIVYYTFMWAERARLKAGPNSLEVRFVPVSQTTRPRKDKPKAPLRTTYEVAFDHKWLIDMAHGRLAERLSSPMQESPFELLPSQFTLSQLERVHEIIVGSGAQSRAFRTALLASGAIEPVAQGKGSRSRLYRFRA